MATRDKDILGNYEDFLKQAEDIIGRPVDATTGGSSENHDHHKDDESGRMGALDIGTKGNKLSKEEYQRLGKLALGNNLRVGNEGDHLHIDDNDIAKDDKSLNQRVFTRKDGTQADQKVFEDFREDNKKANASYFYGAPKKDNKEEKFNNLLKELASKKITKTQEPTERKPSSKKEVKTNQEDSQPENETLIKYKKMLEELSKQKPSKEYKPDTGAAIADSLATLSNIVNRTQGEREVFSPNANLNRDRANFNNSQKVERGVEQQNFNNKTKLLKAIESLKKGKTPSEGKVYQTKSGLVQLGKNGEVKTLYTDPTTEAMLDLSKNRKDISSDSLELRKKKEDRMKIQADRSFDEKNELSDKQVETITALDETANLSKRIKELKKGVNTGVYSNMLHSAAKYLPGDVQNKDQAALKQLVGTGLADYIKSISGAAVSEAEAQRLLANIPNVDDDDKIFDRKMKEFEKTLAEVRSTKLKNIEGFQGKQIKNSTTSSKDVSKEIRRKTKDGRIAIFDDNKNFIRYE